MIPDWNCNVPSCSPSNELLASIDSASLLLHLSCPFPLPLTLFRPSDLWSGCLPGVEGSIPRVPPPQMIQFTGCCQTNFPQTGLTISLTYLHWFPFPLLHMLKKTNNEVAYTQSSAVPLNRNCQFILIAPFSGDCEEATTIQTLFLAEHTFIFPSC